MASQRLTTKTTPPSGKAARPAVPVKEEQPPPKRLCLNSALREAKIESMESAAAAAQRVES